MGAKPSSPKIVSKVDEAILKIKNVRDRINIYKKRAESLMVLERNIVAVLLDEGHHERAKNVMAKILGTQEQLRLATMYLEHVEEILPNLPEASLKRKVKEALKIGNLTCQVAENILSIKNLERITLYGREGMKKHKELFAALKDMKMDGQFEYIIQNEITNEIYKRVMLNKYREYAMVDKDCIPEVFKSIQGDSSKMVINGPSTLIWEGMPLKEAYDILREGDNPDSRNTYLQK